MWKEEAPTGTGPHPGAVGGPCLPRAVTQGGGAVLHPALGCGEPWQCPRALCPNKLQCGNLYKGIHGVKQKFKASVLPTAQEAHTCCGSTAVPGILLCGPRVRAARTRAALAMLGRGMAGCRHAQAGTPSRPGRGLRGFTLGVTALPAAMLL